MVILLSIYLKTVKFVSLLEMARLVVFILVVFSGSCYGTSRVVGGFPATIEEFPSLVQVDFLNAWTNSWSQSCAGTVLNEVYIISAAHCFEGRNYQASHRRIRAGTTYRNSGGSIVHVAYDIKSPQYGVASRWDGDVTVVRLSGYLTLSNVVKQATIVAQGSSVPEYMPLFFAGWGHTSQGGESSPTLQSTTLYIVNHDICRENYANLPSSPAVTTNMFCAGVPEHGGRDHCQGDAGGGVLYGHIVVGVASWGLGCGNGTYPGVSVALGSYSNWILSVAT